MFHRRNAFVVFALAWLTSTSYAATAIKVVEGGEGGGPMTIALDHDSVKSGEVIFQVHNDAVSEEHEMVLVRLKSPDQQVSVVKGKHRVNEKDLDSLGEVSELKPGADGSLKVDLKPGSYLLLCNIKGHFEAGMHTLLTVTE